MWGYQNSSSFTPSNKMEQQTTKGMQRKPLANITNSSRNMAFPPSEKMFFSKPSQERNCVKFQPEFNDDIVDEDWIYNNYDNSYNW